MQIQTSAVDRGLGSTLLPMARTWFSELPLYSFETLLMPENKGGWGRKEITRNLCYNSLWKLGLSYILKPECEALGKKTISSVNENCLLVGNLPGSPEQSTPSNSFGLNDTIISRKSQEKLHMYIKGQQNPNLYKLTSCKWLQILKFFSYFPKVLACAVAEATEPLVASTALGLRLCPPCLSSELCLWTLIMSPPSTGQGETSAHVHIPDTLNCHGWECSGSSHQFGKENQSNWKSIISAAFTHSVISTQWPQALCPPQDKQVTRSDRTERQPTVSENHGGQCRTDEASP